MNKARWVVEIIIFSWVQCSIYADYILTEPVRTTKGFVQGKLVNTVGKNVRYSSFLGIPYAKPPLGYLRFKPPQEADAWTGIYQATEHKNDCPQLNIINGSVVGNEDCLYLNVYTPKIWDTKLRPVMVWIYGGGFESGSSSPESYGPDFLIEEDVVVVAMNYRLGALGFLSLNHRNATGNAGLKDQNFALQWVRQNINNFGGDPKRVTIFGQSAGSVCTLYHVLSDSSAGLFQSAIAMSGSPLNRWGFIPLPEAVSRGFAIGRYLGIDTTDASLMLQKFYTFSADDFVLTVANLANVFVPYMTPTIEDPTIAESPFLTKCSVDKFNTGNFSQVPIMMGMTHTETLSYTGFSKTSRDGIIDGCLECMKEYPDLRHTKQVQFLYDVKTRSKNNDSFTIVELNKISNVTSDILFNDGIDRTQQFLVASSAPVYYYRNSFDYPASSHRVLGMNLDGAGHGDDILQIFWAPHQYQSLDPNSEIGIQRKKMVRMWSNFAKYGNPTPKGTSDRLLNINWPASGSKGTCLEIDSRLTVGSRPTDDFVKYIQSLKEPSLRNENGCS
ncbi:juvenile hormone esterase [Microplitis demolitor]|uniref:juvenile hormone esterase n=1 Tax=Microplitis demolitor TaxID=69319 RepID=UPI0004CCFCC7|nr:juvenile hormone esterase [Microplitis demolitor]